MASMPIPPKSSRDFLTNAQYGIGFPESSIDATTLYGSGGDASYQTYCAAIGLALSPALTDQEQASSILGRWLQLTNTAAVWSGGLLKFIPYGDTATTRPERCRRRPYRSCCPLPARSARRRRRSM